MPSTNTRLSRKAQETAADLSIGLDQAVREHASLLARSKNKEFADEDDTREAYRLVILKFSEKVKLVPTVIPNSNIESSWEELDAILAANPYTRFSIDTHRDWDDARKRKWQAVLFKEKGQILARAYGGTRSEALTESLRIYREGIK